MCSCYTYTAFKCPSFHEIDWGFKTAQPCACRSLFVDKSSHISYYNIFRDTYQFIFVQWVSASEIAELLCIKTDVQPRCYICILSSRSVTCDTIIKRLGMLRMPVLSRWLSDTHVNMLVHNNHTQNVLCAMLSE